MIKEEMNRFILENLRRMEEKGNYQHQQAPAKFVNTNFEDNHGVVVSGGNNTIHIHMHGDSIDAESKKSDNYSDYEEINCNQKKKEVSIDDKIRLCIEALESKGLIKYQYEYAFVLRIIREKEIKDFTNVEFSRFVKGIESVPERHKPSEGSIKQIYFSSSKYPNLSVTGYDKLQNDHVNEVAGAFLEKYNSL